jgi:hypothetical protein
VNISVNIAAKKQINESIISIKTKIIERKNLLRERVNVSKNIANKEHDEDITNRKKLRLQDLIENIKKQLEKEILNKLRSS